MDLQKLEEQYGSGLAEAIQRNIDYCDKEKQKYTIKRIDDSKIIATIVFATDYQAYVYEVSINRKNLMNTNIFSYFACEEALKIMNTFY